MMFVAQSSCGSSRVVLVEVEDRAAEARLDPDGSSPMIAPTTLAVAAILQRGEEVRASTRGTRSFQSTVQRLAA